MSESQPLLRSALASFLPVVLLLVLDFFMFNLSATRFSHFAIALFAAQLLCTLVFAKGEICPGQRGRLVKANLYWVIFWLVWFVLGYQTDNFHFLAFNSSLGLLSICALTQQALNESWRKTLLILTALASSFGLLLNLVSTFDLVNQLTYAPFAQLLIGTVLAALALNISRNRLQGFIALLPFVMVIFLALNAITTSVLLAFAYQNGDLFRNEFALLLYFVLHFFIAAILIWHIIKKEKLSYQTLILLLFVSASLPLWMRFAFIA